MAGSAAWRAQRMNGAALAELAQDFDLSEADIEAQAESLATKVQALAAIWYASGQAEGEHLKGLQRIARRRWIELPHKAGFGAVLNRMSDAAWWRRALRKRFRFIEQHQIVKGAVHKHAAPYVSAKAMRRHERNARRLAELLASLQAVNLDTGETLPLDELIASSQANPAMRRMAMMARIRGIESWATEQGHVALFVTITAPSRMHARHSKTGHANERHDGSTPRQVQAYLGRVWGCFKRSADRQGLIAYGLRTVEPHHDGCPHWHLLVFTRREHVEALLKTLRAYALADSPNEPGAAERRITVERIEAAKGSAAAYVAKYVAKSIDGQGLEDDTESAEDGAGAARRIVAWARLWGIRQFQFFGLPPITPARELYRHSGQGLASQALEAAHAALKAKQYAAYLAALETHALGLRATYEGRPSNRYPGELSQVIRGVLASGADLTAPRAITTRAETWVIQPRPVCEPGQAETGNARRADVARIAFPWTRFNNCAHPMESKSCAPAGATRESRGERGKGQGRRRRPAAHAERALDDA